MKTNNYYDLLGIDYDIEEDKIVAAVDAAYNEKTMELYRLKNKKEISNDEFTSRMEELKIARETLSDAEKRKAYDETIFEEEKTPSKLSKTGAKVACVALAVALFVGGFALGKHIEKTNAKKAGLDKPVVSIEQVEEDKEVVDEKIQREAVEYGDIHNAELVNKRATSLMNELAAANIVNPTTGVAYTVEEITTLIQYANGVYTPETIEEIDILHLDLLNLLISPLNTDPYLYHVVYATGNDEFKDIAIESSKDLKTINFGEAFAAYGKNGVYPLTQWMQEKRNAIYKSTDRTEINNIYCEVGQVMAEIMKGNGCTILVYEDGKYVEYTFTSEQILANHASAMLLTIDAQLIFANHYELRDENNKVVDTVQNEWKVYNKFNSDEPDIVTLDEIQAWINNGCDYEWGIDEVLIDGQTFGQRIQGNMEGMALNNYTMHSGNKSLTK